MSRPSAQARATIGESIRAAGGVYAVARRSGIHYTRLYAWLRGTSDLREAARAALRAQIPEVDDATWGAALAPAPDQQPEASEATP